MGFIRNLTAASLFGITAATTTLVPSQAFPPTQSKSCLLQPKKEIESFPGISDINEKDLKEDVFILSSDANRGRLPGDGPLEREVTYYIEDIFRKANLKQICENGTSYRQSMIIDFILKDPQKDPPKDSKGLMKIAINAGDSSISRIKSVSVRSPGFPYDVRLYRAEENPKNLSRKAIRTHNIIGIIEGLDERLKNEYVGLLAHPDHVGTETLARPGEPYIYNGAGDNASGVAAVLSIIRALDKAKKEGHGPKRSVLILLPTAEEMGLLGSRFFVENPLVPLEKIVAVINLDNVGRGEDKTVSVVDTDANGVSSFFRLRHDDFAKKAGIERTLRTKEASRSSSDHASFAESKYRTPFLYIAEGSKDGKLSPYIHRVTDKADTLHYPNLMGITKLAHMHLLDAANREIK